MKKIHILLFLVLASIFSGQVYAAAPTATVSLSDTTLGIGETTTVTVVFSEQINEATFTTTSPNGSIGTWFTLDGITFTNTFTPTNGVENNPNIFEVDLETVTDVATNTPGTGIASSANYIVDTIAPVVSFADDVSATPTQSDTINITIADTNANPSSYEYGFSADAVCDNTDTYGNTFTSGTNFVINTEAQNGNYICVRASDLAGNISYQASAQTLNIDTTNPILTPVTAVTSPTNDTTPNYTFNASEAGTITYGGACSSSTTVATSGDNTITLNTLAEGTYSNCTLTLTDSSGNTSSVLNIGTFIIDTTAPVISYSVNPSVSDIGNNSIRTYRNHTVNILSNCTDNIDATCTTTYSGNIDASGKIDTSTRGNFNININTVDTAGNTATRTINVDVRVSSSTGGGGGAVITTDNCPSGDFSGDVYDGLCDAATETSSTSSTDSTSESVNEEADENTESTTENSENTDGTTESINTTENEGIMSENIGDENIGDENMTDESSSSIFTDITGNWAQTYIETLAEQNVVAGNANGEFEPERAITRAEFLKMSLLAFGHSYTNLDAEVMTFADVDGDSWIANVVGKAQSLNIIDGVGNNNFRPNATITRAEAIKILLNTAGVEAPEVAVSSFGDVEGWSTRYIEKALELGIVSSNDSFRPNDAITRAESSKIIVQAMMGQ